MPHHSTTTKCMDDVSMPQTISEWESRMQFQLFYSTPSVSLRGLAMTNYHRSVVTVKTRKWESSIMSFKAVGQNLIGNFGEEFGVSQPLQSSLWGFDQQPSGVNNIMLLSHWFPPTHTVLCLHFDDQWAPCEMPFIHRAKKSRGQCRHLLFSFPSLHSPLSLPTAVPTWHFGSANTLTFQINVIWRLLILAKSLFSAMK